MQRCCATRDVCHCGTCSHVKRLCLSSCAEQLGHAISEIAARGQAFSNGMDLHW